MPALETVLGLHGGMWYAFWSGFGSPLLTMIACVAFTVRWAKCDERGCWRRGRYQLPDSLLVVCRRHWDTGRIAREHDDPPD
jgi:hypothetical protein